ncbi:MAG TPA: DUF488 family protein [Candidatus Dormibacteraeota bacterium]|nr:DUF488 family protein [Candidatus Dormibacteraeota bacterium]
MHEFEAQAATTPGIEIKRIYERAERSDGYRVLVDRLWPRGISRRRAALDAWLTDLAPSAPLRRWFHRDTTRWSEFRRRYRAELHAQAVQLQALRARAMRQRVTLLYASRDVRINHALVLRDVLRKAARSRVRRDS